MSVPRTARRLGVCLPASFGLLLGCLSTAAGAAEPPAGAFADSIRVERVNVGVVVIGADGKPLYGLQRSDFEILVDGEQVEITNFAPPVLGSTRSPEAAPTGIRTQDTARPANRDQRELSLIIYVDNLHLRPEHRSRALQRMRELAWREGPLWDRIMVVSAQRSLEVEQPFTTDPLAVTRALIELSEEVAYGPQAAAARREALRLIETERSPAVALARIQHVAAAARSDLEFSLDALREFVHTLGGIPGRKVVAHVSSGLAMNPARSLLEAARRRIGRTRVASALRLGDYDLRREYEALMQVANQNRVTLYMVDASGLSGSAGFDVQSMGPGPDPMVTSIRRTSLQAPLILVAEGTGGHAVLNTNDIAPGLALLRRDLESFYSLAFAPAGGSDGRFHRIEVRVDRPGVGVNHRRGYRLLDPAERVRRGIQAVLAWGIEHNPLAVELRVVAVRPTADGYNQVDVEILIPMERMTLLSDGAYQRGTLDIYLQARDAAGRLSPLAHESLPLRIPTAEIQAERSLRHRMQLAMRSGRHLLALAVRDGLSGASSFLRRPLQVQP